MIDATTNATTNAAAWLPIAEAAALAGVSVRTVQRRIAAGELRADRRPDGRCFVLVERPKPTGEVAAVVEELRQQADATRSVAMAVAVQGEQAIAAWRGRAELAEQVAARSRRFAAGGWALAAASVVAAVVVGFVATQKAAEAAATARQVSDAAEQAKAMRAALNASGEAVAGATEARRMAEAGLAAVAAERDRLAAELNRLQARPPELLAADPGSP